MLKPRTALLAVSSALLCLHTPAAADAVPANVQAAYKAIEATGSGPYSKTTFQKHIPAGMSGSDWAQSPYGYAALGHGSAVTLAEMQSVTGTSATASSAPASPASPATVANVPLAALIANGTTVLGPNNVRIDAQTANRSYSLTTDGKGTDRFEIRAGDHWPGDGSGTARRRSELSGVAAPVGGYSKFSYDLYVVPTTLTGTAQYVIGQRHDTPDASDASGEHPELALRYNAGGVPIFTVCGSTQNPLRTIPKSLDVWKGKASDLPMGQWNHIDIESQSGSWAQLSINGKVIVRYTGPVGYINSRPAYWKFGIYDAESATATMVAYYKNVALKTTQ